MIRIVLGSELRIPLRQAVADWYRSLRCFVDPGRALWVSTPKVQAQQAIYFGETPVNKLACAEMDKIQLGSCAKYHADASESYFKNIYFWKTPIADCGNGKKDCLDYTKWQQAWTALKG